MSCFFLQGLCPPFSLFFFFNDTATTEIYTLSLHDALPICRKTWRRRRLRRSPYPACRSGTVRPDRKSTRLNSSHQIISYAVFCLKKKKYQDLDGPTPQYLEGQLQDQI